MGRGDGAELFLCFLLTQQPDAAVHGVDRAAAQCFFGALAHGEQVAALDAAAGEYAAALEQCAVEQIEIQAGVEHGVQLGEGELELFRVELAIDVLPVRSVAVFAVAFAQQEGVDHRACAAVADGEHAHLGRIEHVRVQREVVQALFIDS